MKRRGPLPILAILLTTVLGVSCGGERSSQIAESLLRLDQIEAALDAVDAEVGSGKAVQLFEVNATELVVNVFVATDLDGTPNSDGRPDGVIHFVFSERDGLETAPEAVAATGPTFARSALDFDSASILTAVTTELPASSPEMFVMTAAGTVENPTGVVEYRVLLQSPQGGQLSVLLTNQGEIIGTDAS